MTEPQRQTEAEYAHFMLIVAEGRDCDHPIQFRHPFEDEDDPNQWLCGVCDTWQMRDRGAR
jgi:hypothetical protein